MSYVNVPSLGVSRGGVGVAEDGVLVDEHVSRQVQRADLPVRVHAEDNLALHHSLLLK